MARITLCTGVDPGIVHTGVVRWQCDYENRLILVDGNVYLPSALDEARRHATRAGRGFAPALIVVEGYRTRGAYATDPRMRELVGDWRRLVPSAVILDNMGVKQVVKQPLMQELGLWKFNTVTHHQDLRSAARIMLFGMLKNPSLNLLLSDVIRSMVVDGETWSVAHV